MDSAAAELNRMFKILFFAVGGGALLIALGVGYYLATDRLAYNSVEITSALLRDGTYDPAAHFKFDRGCVFPPESGLAHTLLSSQGYREVNAIFPDTYTHWTLVLVNDKQRTFQTLYVQNPKVRFGGETICDPKITLQTKQSNGIVSAYATLKAPEGAL